jgi:hypothetical protein
MTTGFISRFCLRNITSSVQSFKLSDFRVVASDDLGWPIVDDGLARIAVYGQDARDFITAYSK